MNNLIKISWLATFVLLISLVLSNAGILEKRYFDFVKYFVIILQIALLALYTIGIIIRKKIILRKGIRIARHKFNDRFIKGETDILEEPLSPTNPGKPSIFKVFVETKDVIDSQEFGIFKKSKSKLAVKDHVLSMRGDRINNGFILDADILMQPGEEVNFQFRKDVNVKSFFVGEIYIL